MARQGTQLEVVKAQVGFALHACPKCGATYLLRTRGFKLRALRKVNCLFCGHAYHVTLPG